MLNLFPPSLVFLCLLEGGGGGGGGGGSLLVLLTLTHNYLYFACHLYCDIQ